MRMRRWIPLLAMVSVLVAAPVEGRAQSAGPYLQAVADQFDIPDSEVGILASWSIPVEEIPVVLFVAQRGGASRDALLALRSRGTAWTTIAGRFSLHAGTFHVPLSSAPASGVLAAVYARYAETDRGDWASIPLDDASVVALVNLRILSAHFGVTPDRVAAEMGRGGSASDVFARLGGDD